MVEEFIWRACEIGDDVDKVKGEEYHSSNNPFESKMKKKENLIALIACNFVDENLYPVVFISRLKKGRLFFRFVLIFAIIHCFIIII